MSDKLKTIELRQLEASNDNSVFAINNTKGATRGQIVIAVPRSNGVGMDAVIIPATWIPIELTIQVSKKQLMESADFRRAFARGMIKLVDSDSAIKVMETDDAREEVERLVNSQQLQRSVMTATNVDDIEIPEEILEETAVAKNLNGVDISDDGKMNGVEMSVVQTIEMLRESKDERGTLATLKAAGELGVLDFKYIMTEAGKDFPLVQDWARAKYNILKNS